jgi:hypothetical protein
LIPLFFIGLFAILYYQEFFRSDISLYQFLKIKIADNYLLWFLVVILIIQFLQINFRTVEFIGGFLVVKNWYWKTTYYRYTEIVKIEYEIEEDGNRIVIICKNGKNLRIPTYLLDYDADSKKYGTKLAEILKRIKPSIIVE